MQTSKQKGFTLIELLVVIVIIGILATISVATFSGYFAKARDSERQSNIRNTATLLKTARAVDSIGTFLLSEAEVNSTLSTEGGFELPDGTAPREYYYVVGAATDEFAIAVCGEENVGEVFVDGTSVIVGAVKGAAAAFCLATPIPPTDGMLDTATPVDVYVVVDMTT